VPEVLAHGVHLYVEQHGSGDPILLIHGTASWAGVWQPSTVRALSDLGRLIVYDRRGCGRSERPEPYETDVGQHAEDAAALIEALDLGPATVVGHSMGGVISLDLALQRPELVRALILVEPPLHFAKHPTPRMLRQLIGAQNAARRKGPVEGAERFMRWATTTADGLNGYDQTPEEERVKLRANSASILRELQSGTGEHMKSRDIATISCPAVLLLGSNTLPEYRKAAQRLAKALPSLETITVPGAGHVLPVSHSQVVVDALRDVRNPARAS
jgi:pimeloyl-ACP methyl ester carboxylesterase